MVTSFVSDLRSAGGRLTPAGRAARRGNTTFLGPVRYVLRIAVVRRQKSACTGAVRIAVSKVGLGVSAATSWRSAPGPMGHGVRHGGGLRFYGAPWFYENKV